MQAALRYLGEKIQGHGECFALGKIGRETSLVKGRKLVIAKMVIVTIILVVAVLLVLGNLANYLSKDRSVSRLITKKIDINGSKQWISLSEEIRSSDKPLVLFLHGGPGSANLSLLNQISPGLKDHAIIVNWDQRNAGKSFSIFQSKNSLSFEQNVEDAHLLTQYLKEKYDIDKISLIGFSAGTALGIMLIDRYPDDYDLFIE